MKVLKVTLPDGVEYYTALIDLKTIKEAAACVREYLKNNNIKSDARPLTVYTELIMTKKEYIALGGSMEADNFFNCKK